MEELVEKYIQKRLKETNGNYPRVLGNVQSLLESMLDGQREYVIKILKK